MNKKSIILSSLILFSTLAVAQIQSESIDVEKSYNPSVKDSDKLDEQPNFDNEVEKNKIDITYTPINIPVKSDYKLSPINPVKLPTKDQSAIYNSFVKGGLGLPRTGLLDIYLDYEFDKNKHFGAFMHHFGTDGNVKNVKVDDDQTQNSVQMFYKANWEQLASKVVFGYDVSSYNYYGLGDLEPVFGTTATQSIYNEMEPTNHYHTAYFNFGLDGYNNKIFDNTDVLLRYFTGDFDAREIYGKASLDLAHNGETASMPLSSLNFKGNATLDLEYVNSDFDETNFKSDNSYSYFKAGINPSVTVSNSENYIKLGLNVVYNAELHSSSGTFKVYPIAEAMIKPIDEINVFAGIKGGLKNNTYYDLVQSNAWMAPGIALLPTNTQYNVYGGVKGVFDNVFQYRVEASYEKVKNFMMMKNVPIQQIAPIPTYMLENSFATVYGNSKNIALKGELNYVGIEHLTATWSAGIYNYDVEGQEEAWNYPSLTSTVSAEYRMLTDEALTLGADVYYVGKRKDIAYDYNNLTAVESGVKDVNAYVDFNVRANYNINDRWSVFMKANNILGDYQRFKNYYTQGAQILGGVVFKFTVSK